MPAPNRTRHDAQRRGVAAEVHVASLLERQGWRVLARNWAGEAGEIDLVVGREGRLRFVEVKLREAGDPVDAIDRRKRRRLAEAAGTFLDEFEEGVDLVDEACFLVAAVEPGPDGGWSVEWIDDAFDG